MEQLENLGNWERLADHFSQLARQFHLTTKIENCAQESQPHRIKEKELPEIYFDGCELIYNHQAINLKRNPRTLALFRAFLSSPNYRVPTVALIKKVYPDTNAFTRSSGYYLSVWRRLLQLISRARIEAKRTFSPHPDFDLNWFTFDYVMEEWSLFTINRSAETASRPEPPQLLLS